uniref:CSON015327 protein n=1 Tax=Culicoides sonorensis TaxID=179676 RepID=A0A336LNV2_CULSO
MSTIEKFQRLKKLLIGQSSVFIENIPISEAGYYEVWNDVKLYYDNPRRILSSHIQSLLDMKPAANAKASKLRQVLDQFKSHMRALKTAKQLQLFGFLDASELGHGACIYLACKYQDGNVTSSLVCSKSRVAPIKTQSIPRLELCGALLLAELITSVKNALSSNIEQVHCFTDSKIVLSWLAKEPSAWKTFTANRIAKIQALTSSNQWYHVKSNENPADLLSRGSSPENLAKTELWWHGPINLINQHNTNQQANENVILNETESKIIEQESKKVVFTVVKANPTFFDELYETKSKLSFITRIVAYVHRFISNTKSKQRQIGPLKYEELIHAKKILARHSQLKSFHEEISALKSGENIPKSSKILSLNPIWDEKERLIKVGEHHLLSPSRNNEPQYPSTSALSRNEQPQYPSTPCDIEELVEDTLNDTQELDPLSNAECPSSHTSENNSLLKVKLEKKSSLKATAGNLSTVFQQCIRSVSILYDEYRTAV